MFSFFVFFILFEETENGKRRKTIFKNIGKMEKLSPFVLGKKEFFLKIF